MIEQTVLQLRAHRVLDDAAFAEYWVEQRQTFRPRGARLLRAELAQRGVPASVATQAAAATAESAEDDAYRAASRRAGQLRHLERAQFEARVGGFLARRGFDWETITAVVARLTAERLSS